MAESTVKIKRKAVDVLKLCIATPWRFRKYLQKQNAKLLVDKPESLFIEVVIIKNYNELVSISEYPNFPNVNSSWDVIVLRSISLVLFRRVHWFLINTNV